MDHRNDDYFDADDERPVDEIVDEGSALLSHQSADSTQNLLLPTTVMEPKKGPQIFSALAASFGAMAFGTAIGFSSPAGPLFLQGHGGVNLTTSQNDWVSSSVTLGALFGGPVGGMAIGAFGRRTTMLASAVPYIVGWALIIGGQNFSMLLFGRLISGLSIGITTVTVPTYLGEISSANIRGTLSAMFQLMVCTGVLYGYSLGPAFDNFRLIAAFCAIPPMLHGIAMFFCKESPLYLLAKNRDTEALDALHFLRGKDYDVAKEAEIIKASIVESKRNKITFTEIREPYILKPFVIVVMLMVFQQLSGINALLFNLSLIFEEAGTSVSHNVSAIIIGIVNVISTVASTFLIDRLGRRILLQISSFVMCLSLTALGAYFYLKEQTSSVSEAEALVQNYGWLPLTSLVIFMLGFSFGYGGVPWIMMGEMFFPNVKELAASVATSSNWFCAFITTVTFTALKDAIGSSGVYWMFAGICAINFVFTTIIVPETRGKTIEEITAAFGRQSRPVDRSIDTQY